MPEENRIFTRNFILVTLVAFGAFSSFQLIMTVIPLYTLSLGGSKWDVGLTAGIIALSATGARLFSGPLIDRIGRKPVLYVGAGILLLSTLIYYVSFNIPLLFLARLIHGLGFGAMHVTATILIADITPKNRQGEGQGYFTAFTIITLAIGPPLGYILYQSAGYTWVIIAVTMVVIATGVLAFFVPETGKKVENPRSFISLQSLVEKAAVLPAIILGLTTWGHGAIVAFLPLFTSERHILNPGLYFTMMSITAVVSRGFVGRLSDRFGRGLVLVPGLLSAISGILTLHFATNTPMLMTAGLLFGLGFSTVSPIVFAMTAERVRPERRGTAMGMVSASNDLGITAGSLLGGIIIAQTGFDYIFLVAAALLAAAIFIFISAARKKHDGSPQETGAE